MPKLSFLTTVFSVVASGQFLVVSFLTDNLEEEQVESKRKNGVIDFIHNHCKLTHFKEKKYAML